MKMCKQANAYNSNKCFDSKPSAYNIHGKNYKRNIYRYKHKRKIKIDKHHELKVKYL